MPKATQPKSKLKKWLGMLIYRKSKLKKWLDMLIYRKSKLKKWLDMLIHRKRMHEKWLDMLIYRKSKHEKWLDMLIYRKRRLENSGVSAKNGSLAAQKIAVFGRFQPLARPLKTRFRRDFCRKIENSLKKYWGYFELKNEIILHF
ncbi:MAG: hypothetical protein K9J17_14675 [Flavobacteriales bacterium]|nr:hypothetical protein [Flavobacteriales bacterium]